ncbi:p21-activated protein kinase-interacting protein 1-like [Trichonephila inaurata madagascariensis]|uniref:p21-activated protein kinase-interacting protein 1-like n=1 Tax=Trichonephila inaurata madagascariensis TaxID=2747483 RepID=A0A8X6WS70_9ARAC|nr:p21-activated protein kinase-interacting protein 1-like [Trichonephila inaurata madagascariensis]
MTADVTMASPNVLMEIVIGSYEKYLLGYNLEMNLDQFILKPSFSTEAHIQSIKCIASSDKFLASGSIDETIQLFNMKTRKEIGALQKHNGTITCLEFFDYYLFSSGEDNNICIWSTKNWQCEKTLPADIVRWTPDGSHFLVSSGNSIDVYSVEKATVVWTIDFHKKICDFTFIKDDIVAIGGESEFIQFYDLKSKLKCFEIKVKTNRIKALKCVSTCEETFLVSASSDGCIKIWHLDLSETELKARKVAKVKTGCRPTCMTIILKSEN